MYDRYAARAQRVPRPRPLHETQHLLPSNVATPRLQKETGIHSEGASIQANTVLWLYNLKHYYLSCRHHQEYIRRGRRVLYCIPAGKRVSTSAICSHVTTHLISYVHIGWAYQVDLCVLMEMHFCVHECWVKYSFPFLFTLDTVKPENSLET